MPVEELPGVDTNVDLTQILPIQQKRTIAFVNHFIMQTVSYLNSFAQSCESRFMDFEYKIQKIEASLLILESQLSSISGLNNLEQNTTDTKASNTPVDDSKLDLPDIQPSNSNNPAPEQPETVLNLENIGVKACDDSRFKKFFNMLQFGVPQPAVKQKMQNEGVDPNILDKPNDVIPGPPEEISHSAELNTSNLD